MRNIMKVVAGICLLCASSLWGQPLPKRMIDPIFSIEYDPGRVHFEPLPSGVRKSCDLSDRGPLWVFASARVNDVEYILVSGLMKVFPDGPGEPSIEIDEIGVALSVRGRQCKSRSADWVMSGRFVDKQEASSSEMEPIKEVLFGYRAREVCVDGECHFRLESKSEEIILDRLFADALDRYAKAFGGKQAFEAEISKLTNLEEKLKEFPLLRRQLREYRK